MYSAESPTAGDSETVLSYLLISNTKVVFLLYISKYLVNFFIYIIKKFVKYKIYIYLYGCLIMSTFEFTLKWRSKS